MGLVSGRGRPRHPARGTAGAVSTKATIDKAATLTVLKTGTLLDSQGTIECRVPVLRSHGMGHRYIFDGNGPVHASLALYFAGVNDKVTVVYGTGTTDVTITSSGGVLAKNMAHGIALHWSAEGGMELLVDGAPVGSDAASPSLVLGDPTALDVVEPVMLLDAAEPATLPVAKSEPVVYLSSKADGTCQLSPYALLDEFCISFLRRPTDEIKARCDAGTSLVMDGDTGIIYRSARLIAEIGVA